MRILHSYGALIGWMLAPGIVLAIIGPFGSFSAPFSMRLLYWVPTMAVGAVLGGLAAQTMERAWPALAERRLVFVVAHGLIVTLAMVLIVWGWGRIVFGEQGGIRLSLRLVLYVGVIAFAISALRLLADRPRSASASPATAAGADAVDPGADAPRLSPPALSRRLKPELRAAEIFAIEAEDHYVRVHTGAGSDLILLRLSDAIAEMDGVAGLRPHRSWWVARAAIIETRREDGRLTLALKGGLSAPVSRAAAADIRVALEAKV